MAAVVVGERLLVAGLAFVVDLFRDSQLDLVDHLGRIEPAEALAQQGSEQIGVLQVGHDRLTDPWVLHLHCYRALDTGGRVAQQCPVDLADRRSSDRGRVELGEDLVDRTAEFTLDGLEREVDRHRRCIRLQL